MAVKRLKRKYKEGLTRVKIVTTGIAKCTQAG